ncbi:type II toxin-antitoxin system HigB family toxin [Pseudomonas huaxiensis]|uniref:type II toxin-antitoxin system HigB family toxin n=1 Tax=Pseudomonas huaxiensis TaxID=2213017 RepID=UPI000DA697AB
MWRYDIKGNECLLIAWINPRNRIAYIKEILSHAEYDNDARVMLSRCQDDLLFVLVRYR